MTTFKVHCPFKSCRGGTVITCVENRRLSGYFALDCRQCRDRLQYGLDADPRPAQKRSQRKARSK